MRLSVKIDRAYASVPSPTMNAGDCCLYVEIINMYFRFRDLRSGGPKRKAARGKVKRNGATTD